MALGSLVFLLAWLASWSMAHAVGNAMFSIGTNTGQKPQSKLWYHDGSYWAILDGPNGIAFFEKVGSSWNEGGFIDAILTTSSGAADVKWSGTNLFVLIYSSSPKLYKYTYDSGGHTWSLMSGFPVSVPKPSGSETMAIDLDSTGRLWATAEGGGDVNVYYTTSSDHQNWSSAVTLQTGLDADDITAVIAFGGDKVGVFWSDQNAEEYGFRIHNDGDPPTTWSSTEIVDSGSGVADDHLNLATDSTGRVWCTTKNASNELQVHRRSSGGGWTSQQDVTSGNGTRSIIMVAEDDNLLYVVYTNWDTSPRSVYYRTTSLSSLTFGNETAFMTHGSLAMNNATGMKQVLPSGSLMAIATLDDAEAWWNGFGNPPAGGGDTPPTNLVATLQSSPTTVDLTWNVPSSGTPDGYNIYRQEGGGAFTQVNGSLVTGTSFTDTSPPADFLCYQVTADTGGNETAASNTDCVDNTPTLPPDVPENLMVVQVDPGSAARVLGLSLDEGSGLVVSDFSGMGNHGWLGENVAADAADPVFGSSGGRNYLTFDGLDDMVAIPDAASLDIAGSFTLETWIRPATLANAVIIEKGATTERTFSLRMTSAGEVIFGWSEAGTEKTITSGPQLSVSTWHHVAGVYDANAGENRIYVDGLLVQTGNASGTPHSNTAKVRIGAASDSADYYGGDIDQMHVFAAAVYGANFIPSQSKTKLKPGSLPQIASGGAGIQLQWNAPSAGVIAVSYNIYRTMDSTTALLNTTSVLQTTFLDADSLLGARSYAISAISSLGLEGTTTAPESISVAATVALASPPEGLQTELFNTTTAFTMLSWQAPTQGPLPMGYHVYRADDGAFPQRITALPVTGLQFSDSTLTAATLCYSIRSIVADGREGLATSEDCFVFLPNQRPSAPLFVVAAEDTTPQGPASGVAAYRMDEGSGQTLADATGNGHTGTLGSSPGADSSDPVWVAGISGNALQFDGSNDFVEIDDAPDLQIAGSFTVEAWFQLTGSGSHAILSKGKSQQRNHWIVIDPGGAIDFRWETSGGANHGTASGSVVTDSNWHHVACVYDMGLGEDRIYFDGVLVELAADSGVPATSTDPFYIGGRLGSSSLKEFFEGSIDLARVSAGPIYTADFTPPTDYAAPGGTGAKIDLAWQSPALGYTDTYKIYRSVDGAAWTLLDSTVTELTYVDASLDSVGPLVCYMVSGVDGGGQEGILSPPVCVGSTVPTSVWEQPTTLATLPMPGIQVGPNPFNPNVRIQFDLARDTHVRLRIFDVRGHLVVTLQDGWATAGVQSHIWDGRSSNGSAVASGSYFVLMQAADRTERRKITLLR